MKIRIEEPLVSIIIVNYNGYKHLKECFDTLDNLIYNNKEIIFVDNGSIDNSVDFIKEHYKNVKIIKLEKNYGYAIPNNLAAAQARGKYIALLNNDVSVNQFWLSELVKIAESAPTIGIVASKIYYYETPEVINYAGGFFEKFGYSRHICANLKDNEKFNSQRETFFACGAALLIKRTLIDKIGLFDPLYFAYCEDLDLSWRAWIAGYKVIYAPKSFIYHKSSSVLKEFIPRRLFLNERNRLRTILKNYEIRSLVIVLPIYFKRRLLILKKNIFIIINNQNLAIFYFLIYIKTFFWNLYHIHSLIKNRKIIGSYRKIDDKKMFQIFEKTGKI